MTDILKAITNSLPVADLPEVPPAVAVVGGLALGAVAIAYLIRESNESNSKRDKEGMKSAFEDGFDEYSTERTYGFNGSAFGVHEKTTAKRTKPA